MNLNQVTMPSLNVDLATAFYQKLGLTLIVDARPRYVRFVCPNGQAFFSVRLAFPHQLYLYWSSVKNA